MELSKLARRQRGKLDQPSPGELVPEGFLVATIAPGSQVCHQAPSTPLDSPVQNPPLVPPPQPRQQSTAGLAFSFADRWSCTAAAKLSCCSAGDSHDAAVRGLRRGPGLQESCGEASTCFPWQLEVVKPELLCALQGSSHTTG